MGSYEDGVRFEEYMSRIREAYGRLGSGDGRDFALTQLEILASLGDDTFSPRLAKRMREYAGIKKIPDLVEEFYPGIKSTREGKAAAAILTGIERGDGFDLDRNPVARMYFCWLKEKFGYDPLNIDSSD